jgi:hypothetical protein
MNGRMYRGSAHGQLGIPAHSFNADRAAGTRLDMKTDPRASDRVALSRVTPHNITSLSAAESLSYMDHQSELSG